MAGGFITFDMREVQRAFDDLAPVMQKASVNALNIVGRSGEKEMISFITTAYKIEAPSLKRLRTIIPASAFRKNPVFTIRIQKVARGLWKYGARKVPSGVTYRVSTPKSVKKAWIGTWRKGENQQFVFIKDRKKRFHFKKSQATGKQIKRINRFGLQGPAVWTLYRSQKARRILAEIIKKDFEPTLNKKFDEQFEKRR